MGDDVVGLLLLVSSTVICYSFPDVGFACVEEPTSKYFQDNSLVLAKASWKATFGK